MDPRGGPPLNMHHQRPLDPHTQPANTAGDEENGGLHSAWSPDRGEEDKYNPWHAPSSSSGSRFSMSISSMVGRKPTIWSKIRGRNVGWAKSIKAVVLSSWLNVILILLLPVTWTLHFLDLLSHVETFILSFLSLIPIVKLLDFGAENFALYCGNDIGDLILVSLSNAVEGILALWLLVHWELRLLQSTIIGVAVLRLLFIPGVAYIVGGARMAAQELHPHVTELNHSLLIMGVLAFLLPISFFTALDRGFLATGAIGEVTSSESVVSDFMRGELLKVSRGMAVILLAVYICSRFYLHNPPGEVNKLHERDDAPEELKKLARALEEQEPEINFSMAAIVMIIGVAMMAVTAEMLVESIEPMREKYTYSEEWFGLILLPLVSYSADALVSSVIFIRTTWFGHDVPHTMASYRYIDTAIQFILFWSPLVVLLGWIMSRPMSLLFDLFEVAILIGSCFLLNYVTADSKTNWAEGVMLVALYLMIALAAWFYPQQPEIGLMLSKTNVAVALQDASSSLEGNLGSSPSATTSVFATATVTDTVLRIPAPTQVTSAASTGNAELSEKLQQLLTLYDVLLAENLKQQEHQKQPQSAPNSSAAPKTSKSTSTEKNAKNTKSTRQQRKSRLDDSYNY